MADSERMIRAEEVTFMVGISLQTLNSWYRWKRSNPDHELARLLPEFVQTGPRQQRFWTRSSIWKLVEFKNSIPHGRNGILGSNKTKRRNENGKN